MPVPLFIRLLGALEDLAAQEAMQLAGENYAAVRQTQERAEPLVTELARLGGSAVTTALRPRLEALLERRRKNEARLTAQIARVREALALTQTHQRRLAHIAPAYGRTAVLGPVPQLSVQG